MTDKPQTAWMWQDEYTNGVSGATVNYERNEIEWFDSVGCACGGSNQVQTIADFIASGPRFVTPPDDVLEEMRAALAQAV